MIIRGDFYIKVILSVKAWIDGVEVLRIHRVNRKTDSIAKSLIMHKLSLAKEFERFSNVGIVHHSDEVVVGHARLLLCYYHVFATFLLLIKTAKSLDL